MTLNILLASSGRVFLSSDFRITSSRPIDDPPTQKQIPVMRRDWAAIVAFSGVAEFGPRPNRFVLAERLPDRLKLLPFEAALANFVTSLLELGCALRVPNAMAAHTFCATGFEFGRPFALLVSNFQVLPEGETIATSGNFRATILRGVEKHIFVGGRPDSVTTEDRKMLSGMIDTTRDNRQIHRALAETNRRASERDSTVGAATFTAHMLADESVEAMPHGVDLDVEYIPRFVFESIQPETLRPRIDDNGMALPRRLIGMCTARPQSGKVTPQIPSMAEDGDLLLMAVHDTLTAWMYCFRNVADPISEQTPEVIVRMAEQMLRSGDFKQADLLFEKALLKAPSNTLAILGRAHALVMRATDCMLRARVDGNEPAEEVHMRIRAIVRALSNL